MSTFPVDTVPFPHATLGYAQADSYDLESPNDLERTVVMDGPPRYRNIGPARTWGFSLLFKWSPSQLSAFQNFYHVDLQNGQKWTGMTVSMGAGNWNFAVHGLNRYRASRRGIKWELLWLVEGMADDPNFPLPWQVDSINAGGAYSPSLDRILAGTAGDPSSGIIDGGTSN